MKKRFFLLLGLFLSLNTVVLLLDSCDSSTKTVCNCHFFKSMTLSPMNNADSLPRKVGSEGVRARAFMLALTVADSIYVCNARKRLLPRNTALAIFGDYCFSMGPVKITVTSDKDFDYAHPAGADLIDLFNPGARDVSALHSGTNNLYLLQSPAAEGEYRFMVTVSYSDPSRNATVITEPVKLLL